MQSRSNFAVSRNLARTGPAPYLRFAVALVTLVCIGAGSAGTAHAYTLKLTKSGERVRWSSDTITMRVDPKLEELLGRTEVRTALGMATDAWRGLTGVPTIAISNEAAPGYRYSERTNGVYLMDPWPFPKEQLAVTVSTYAANGRMLGADILVNPQVKYALLADGEDHVGMTHHDMAAVLTHEMGHVLGLDESEEEDATMWPYIRAGEVHQRSLEEDDQSGVIEAYAGAAPAEAMGCGQASVAGRATQPTAALVWMLAAAALVWRRKAQLRK